MVILVLLASILGCRGDHDDHNDLDDHNMLPDNVEYRPGQLKIMFDS